MDRKNIKEKEVATFKEIYRKNPELFQGQSMVDDVQFLERIGILFPDYIQKNLQQGYIKVWPQDFIVEEISQDGHIQTISLGDFFDTTKSVEEGDNTLYGTLVKCQLATFEAVDEIALLLGIEKTKIQFAGIKDKDAITAQQISLRTHNVNKLKQIQSPYFFLKDVYMAKGALTVGSLQGNRFTILVRTDNNFDKKKFQDNLEAIEHNGFFNFFYSQRFGSPRFINWFWGLLILRGDYKGAVMSFLCSEGQREVLYFKQLRREIKKYFGDWKKIKELLDSYPLVLQNEIKVIEHLENNPEDFVGALAQIPEQIQLWVFAYASILFNRKISEILANKKSLPEKLPLILSNVASDWAWYEPFLQEDDVSFASMKNIKPFQSIQWRQRKISTIEKVKIHTVEFINEGVVLEFSLPKACYATTFLSQLFLLGSGNPPDEVLDTRVDTQSLLGKDSAKEVLEKFSEISYSKRENIFEK